MRGAVSLLLAADRCPLPYATRTPYLFGSLLKLSSSLQEVGRSVGVCERESVLCLRMYALHQSRW